MKRATLAIILVGLFVLPNSAATQTSHRFRVAPSIGLSGGDTRFELTFPYLKIDSTIGMGRSELVFPLDYVLAGIELQFAAVRAERAIWTADVRVAKSVRNPQADMTDRDWLDPGFGVFEFSSTESKVEGSLEMIGVDISRLLFARGPWELAACVGFEYQVVKQRLVDLRGWQIDFEGVFEVLEPEQIDSLTVYRFAEQVEAGTYEVRHFRPRIGLWPRFVYQNLTIGLKGLVSPVTSIRDIDDHLLRGFQIRTSGEGVGYAGELRIAYEANLDPKHRLFFGLVGDYSEVKADMSGTRKFYRTEENDPSDPSDDIPAGTTWGETHEVSTEQYGIRVMFGVRF